MIWESDEGEEYFHYLVERLRHHKHPWAKDEFKCQSEVHRVQIALDIHTSPLSPRHCSKVPAA
jgi:hypothetical protein